ncbi:class I SAM-dependent methyltransferase [Legionella bononiensis]|uniref:SAM-dependent methyltransferase n=1 Tax=Legionella bononiensis TaxID=2793102 RepID=A0ABS1WFZ1_9GAMM|nr:SAM-dependent methyltransferase [Legionella bononiensis]MBL7481728.1 SAM-dependent methyltransferase [Legionella bononiensis]MBL7528276.1 SAM-dependent methyltransferase [Legionella bononiensis]MBL7562751.1 SAM-dependent methyltransferase [Legionella bononiensis]
MSLIHTLHTQLEEQQELPFIEFMQLALYAPGEGYYSSGLPKLGKQGDFITAPELTPLFGKTLANQCKQILTSVEHPVLFEFGAGTGALCIDVLNQLEQLNCLPDAYYILEVSSNLRHRQQELFQQKIPHLAHRIFWLERWPETPFNGVVLANEVLDAMPVNRFMLKDNNILESYISLNKAGELTEQFKPCQNERLSNYIKNNLPQQTTEYLSEVNLFIEDWLVNIYKMINQGAVFLIDYGFPRHEYYHPDRNQGTLMCHYQHHAHPDPLLHPGEQDITAHVDFTHVAEAGQQAGFHIAGYTNQASFLLANGLLSFLNTLDNEKELFRAKQAIKQLTDPSEMGELFKVIALTKNLDIDLNGFLLNDKRVSL